MNAKWIQHIECINNALIDMINALTELSNVLNLKGYVHVYVYTAIVTTRVIMNNIGNDGGDNHSNDNKSNSNIKDTTNSNNNDNNENR